ncbi:hypothetical protein CKO40_10910 [Halochromatium glycolicum]|uniref:Uncharacterized protein n=1 Tax=Halochromatium glycolicum TaxID=85075 RepID=A0AAJ0X9Q6_9GAMM|nr:hypothetical protein [Halochromatium glycolicum]
MQRSDGAGWHVKPIGMLEYEVEARAHRSSVPALERVPSMHSTPVRTASDDRVGALGLRRAIPGLQVVSCHRRVIVGG